MASHRRVIMNMASSTHPQQTFGAALFFVFILIISIMLALASTLTIFEGPRCRGKSKDINSCGCFNLNVYIGSFHFVYTEGQAAKLCAFYNYASHELPDCLHVETHSCVVNEYSSMRMLC